MPYHIKAPYIGRANTVEYQRFSEDYFSGADINIYFGDIWIDEVTALQVSLRENVQPIFGYASYTADAWSRGTRLVSGSLRINFISSYYLHHVIQELSKTGGGTSYSKTPRVVLDEYTHPKTREEFEKMAINYQKAIWGIDPHSLIKGRADDSYFYREDQSAIRENGFNILINYGPSIEETYRQLQKGRTKPGMVSPSNTTIKSIVGVQLSEVVQTIELSGQPIQEEYTFIARDLDYTSFSDAPAVSSPTTTVPSGGGGAYHIK